MAMVINHNTNPNFFEVHGSGARACSPDDEPRIIEYAIEKIRFRKLILR
jgi:hypothetical protein